MKNSISLGSVSIDHSNTNLSGGTSDTTMQDRLEVLVVDDDQMSRKLIQRLLEREFEANVTTLGNGLEGLAYAQKHSPSLIILDLMLPGMNGFEILKKMRSDNLLEDTKVILVSARSRSEDIERGFDLTADEYITKPFQPKEFTARVQKLLRD